MSDHRCLLRSRWAAVGAAIATTVCAGGMLVANAAGSSGASSFVPITPCRLLDTRTGTNVGSRSVPLQAQEAVLFNVQGANGNCSVPATATGVSANVTVADGTEASFLTIWPTGAPRPLTSTNNWSAGQAPTANQVDIKLASDGTMSVFNNTGTVNLIVDVVGYYEPVGGPTFGGGVEFAQGADATLTSAASGPTAITSIVVTAPVAGFVVVNSTANMVIPSGNSVNCEISTSALIGNIGVQYVGGPAVTVLTQSRGFAVAAGDTTFFQVCQQMSGSGSTAVQSNFLTAVYSPNRV